MDEDTKSGWEYKPDGGAASTSSDNAGPAAAPAPAAKNVSWEAPEYIEHHHGAGWYTALLAVTLALATIVYFVSSRDLIATIIVLILGVIVGAFARYKPGIAKYEINSVGLSINGKTYRYGDYKSFAIIREGVLSSASLLPMKRFTPPVTAYFEPSEEKTMVAALGDYLPYEDRKLDAVERLSRRLRL